jgi:NADH dehydrogenase
MAEARTAIVIAGGGYVGVYCALELERLLRPEEADVTLISRDNFMLFWPLLSEVASGTIEPRHVAVPLRKVLGRSRLLTGTLTRLDARGRVATFEPQAGVQRAVAYDEVVVGLGSIARVPPIPGVRERAFEFKSITDAIELRNHVLARLEAAEATADPQARARALTFVLVGGGYTGIEALGELQDMARTACRYFPTLEPDQMRWVLVEATDGILPEVEGRLSEYAGRVLQRRGVEIRLRCQVESAEDGIELSCGERLESDTLVWAAGVRPSPSAEDLDVPLDDTGRVAVDTALRVPDREGMWAAGDVAAVPDLVTGDRCPPTAQHALRQGRQLARNVAATLRGEPPAPYRYRPRGEFITLGRRQGVGRLGSASLRGSVPWLLRRAYYLSIMPTLHRRLRVLADWTIGLPFRHDIVQLVPDNSRAGRRDR